MSNDFDFSKSATMRFPCPACSQPMQCPNDCAGKNGVCPKCKKKIRVPAGPAGKVADSEPTTAEALAIPTATFSPPPLPRQRDDAPTLPPAQAQAIDQAAVPAWTPGRGDSRARRERRDVWLCVALWCLLPFVYMLFTALMNIPQARVGGPGPAPGGGGLGMDFGQASSVLGAGLLLLLYGWACWCAVGVICGFGLERAIQAWTPNDRQ